LPLPTAAGIGLKPVHYQALLDDADPPGFVEVHAENYMGAGGAAHAWLTKVHERLPLSVHGVGLSIGGEDDLDEAHLERLAKLIDRYQPESFSEHLAWSSHGRNYFNDLLPIVYDEASLARVCAHVDRVQARLRRRMLLENTATYVEFAASTMSEAGFLSEVIRRTGCGLLLDVNNIHVSCSNHGRDAAQYLAALPLAATGEIHLAGFSVERDADGAPLLIDSHGSAVADVVWNLYARALEATGPMPTLVEWDHEVPEYGSLRAQARRAEEYLLGRRHD
jgi:uncharacterized protein (UPF0276 family)